MDQSLRTKRSRVEPVAFLRAELIVFKYLGVRSAAGRDSVLSNASTAVSPITRGVLLPHSALL